MGRNDSNWHISSILYYTTSQMAGGVTTIAAARKQKKYTEFLQYHFLIHIVIESFNLFYFEGLAFLKELSQRITVANGGFKEFQRFSVDQ